MLIGGKWFEGVDHMQPKGYTPISEAVEPAAFDEMFDIELLLPFFLLGGSTKALGLKGFQIRPLFGG